MADSPSILAIPLRSRVADSISSSCARPPLTLIVTFGLRVLAITFVNVTSTRYFRFTACTSALAVSIMTNLPDLICALNPIFNGK
ncbi:hypothetical protein DERF_008988 [Dermatophagoides farinae]|uniref:Uncharacterized protein n=1 Tax=Dermatophagoides farinae TaxID=6954 RepID=A0A922HWD5_DERFA|nr:hypothetical protein DERF_008988 [Dermatophagoides farinae]